jgi:hypothetical protein
MIQGGTILSEYSQAIFPAGARTLSIDQFGGSTLSAVFLVGAAGLVLGILALIGIHPTVLVPVSIIAFGTALVLSSNAVWHLYVVRRAMIAGAATPPVSGNEVLASEMASGSAGMQALAGLAAVVLGILALAMTGANAAVLFLVALIVLGATLMLTGSTLSGMVLSFMPQRPIERPFGETRPTQAE